MCSKDKKMPNRFSVVLRTRSFKIVGFEDLIAKEKERAEKKYPLSISVKKSVLQRLKKTKSCLTP